MGSNPILCIYRYGLVVRIEGLHPSGPGSIPGIGILRPWFSGRMLPFQGSDPGSIPGGRTFYRRSSAGLEHRPFKPRVAGSNPADGVKTTVVSKQPMRFLLNLLFFPILKVLLLSKEIEDSKKRRHQNQ